MRLLTVALTFLIASTVTPAMAEVENYKIDKGHTFVTFEANHIGFAWIPGTFNEIDGSIKYDPEERGNSSAEFTIQTASLDTEHAKRDKHLRGEDFFNVSKYPTATFKSTEYKPTGDDTAAMTGELTIKGVTREVEFEVKELAAKKDPWDNFRRAFVATTEINMDDFEVDNYGLPPVSKTVELRIAVEALRQ